MPISRMVTQNLKQVFSSHNNLHFVGLKGFGRNMFELGNTFLLYRCNSLTRLLKLH